MVENKRPSPATLRVRGYLVNDEIIEYEVEPQMLIDKFIGDDTGAPLQELAFELDSGDGHRVWLSVPCPKQPRKGPRLEASEMFAWVKAHDGPTFPRRYESLGTS
jgi:hypothetical protein